MLPSITSLEDLGRIIGGDQVSVTSAGTIDTALRHPNVWRSVNKIANIVQFMPWQARRGRRVVDPKPGLLVQPSPEYLLVSTWKRTAATSMLLGGGVTWLADAPRPTRLDLVHPDCVGWSSERGWTVDGVEYDEWPLGPLVHVPIMTLPGSPQGISPIEYARRTTYTHLAAQEFGSNGFRDGMLPPIVVQPEDDPGPDGAELLKRKVQNATKGTQREPLVVPKSTDVNQIEINPEDSQFLDTMKFSGAQVAGFFGLLPEHIGLPVEGTGLQYSNRENRQQDVLQDAITQVTHPLEEAVGLMLARGMSVKFNYGGLLRPDTKTRFDIYRLNAEIEAKTGKPVLSHEEVRDLEDMEPLPDQDDQPSAREISEMVQKIYLGVGVVITDEEARDIIRRGGADIPAGPLPDSDTED